MIASALVAATAMLSATTTDPEPLIEVCPNFLVFFDEGSTRINAPGRSVIDNWANLARMHEAPYVRYTIEVVAMDQSQSEAANLTLSFRRGQAIVRYLARRGFPAGRFRIRAMGQSQEPWYNPDSSPELNRAENRRATLILETTASNWRRIHGDLVC